MAHFVPEFTPDSLYTIESRDKLTGALITTLPYQNIQCEFMLNKPEALRFDVQRNHEKATRQNFLPGKTEVWLYRGDVLIFAGPLWQVTGGSEENILHLTANGLLSYLQYRFIDYDRLFLSTTSGGGIAQFLIEQTQLKGGGDLRITYGGATTTALGYRVQVLRREYKPILAQIEELSDNEVTGFDYRISPDRVFAATPEFGHLVPGALEWGVNVSTYTLPIFGSTIRNNIAVHGPGEGESQLIGLAHSTPSIDTYGLMEGTEDFGSAGNQSQVNTRAQRVIADRKDPLCTPGLTIHGRPTDFIGQYLPGDTTRIVINNGYDQYDNILRITGYQLTVGANDQEAINVYIDAGAAEAEV